MKAPQPSRTEGVSKRRSSLVPNPHPLRAKDLLRFTDPDPEGGAEFLRMLEEWRSAEQKRPDLG
jgi:hypothetical protein